MFVDLFWWMLQLKAHQTKRDKPGNNSTELITLIYILITDRYSVYCVFYWLKYIDHSSADWIMISSPTNIKRYTFNYLVSVTCYDINIFWLQNQNQNPSASFGLWTNLYPSGNTLLHAPVPGSSWCQWARAEWALPRAAILPDSRFSLRINSHFGVNPFRPTESEPAHLQVVYKSDVHARCSFAGIHAEGKHVIQGSRHVCDDLSPLNPRRHGGLCVQSRGSDPCWRSRELQGQQAASWRLNESVFNLISRAFFIILDL